MHKCFKRRQRSQKPLFDREYELHFPHRRPLSQVQADCWTSENSDRCLRYVPRMKSGWRDKMKPGWQDEIYWNFSKALQILCKMANQLITLDIFQFPSCYLWDVDIESDFLIQQQAFLSATDSAPKRKSPISISWYILKQKEKKYLYMEELWDYMRLVRGLGRASICLQMTPPTTNEKKSWSTSLST